MDAIYVTSLRSAHYFPKKLLEKLKSPRALVMDTRLDITLPQSSFTSGVTAIYLPAKSFVVHAHAPVTGVSRGFRLFTDEQLKQNIFVDFNFCETALEVNSAPNNLIQNDHQLEIRWVKNEVSQSGHATLASADILWKDCAIHFRTTNGVLVLKKKKELIFLYMPAGPLTNLNLNGLTENLIKITIGNLPYDDVKYDVSRRQLLIRLSDSVSKKDLKKINPSFEKMINVYNSRIIKMVIVTLRARRNDDDVVSYDFYSRVFAPWLGVNEDPVTGSAHVTLGSYWSRVLNKMDLIAYQCSRRGGILWVSIQDGDRVEISGKARIVLRGNLQL